MNRPTRLIHDLLATSAARDPAGPALEGRSEIWSYARLEDASSRVAAALIETGIQAGERVCICARKEPRTIAALFGILRAGAVFVPLDRTAPVARLARIATDCGARVLAGEGPRFFDLAAALSGSGGLDLVIDLGASGAPPAAPRVSGSLRRLSWEEVLAVSPGRAAPSRGPDDLAYILYTSGSTGVPKGVMISHENALAFTSWATCRFSVGPADRVTSVAPLHFDLSTFDLYTTLEGGGTVLLVPEEIALFPASLATFLEASRATITYMVPSALTGMLLRGDLAQRDLGSLRLLLFAGEVFPAIYLTRLMEALPGIPMFNLYGPTETNVCTCYEVVDSDRGRATPVPIGIPASGDVLFALDDDGKPVDAPDMEGELYVAGPTVALGYWGREAGAPPTGFLEGHPLAPPGVRVYRTGDRVSRGEAGNWIFHGRRDHMVKSRGFRIEAALYRHAAVAEAAALAIPDPEIGSRIKACIALKEGSVVDPAEIQRHCAERLARYMVPEIVEFLPALPKTSTGKIDRMSLSRRESGSSEGQP